MRINHFAPAIIAALGTAFAPTADAVTQDKVFEFSPGDACQLSVPTTDTKVRPRANGYRNEGTTNQFVICGMGGYENTGGTGSVMYTALFFSSTDGLSHTVSCTGVGGLTGYAGPYYSSKTIVVPATGFTFQKWQAQDFGGAADNPIPYSAGLNLSVTCTLPPNVAVQGYEAKIRTDVGA